MSVARPEGLTLSNWDLGGVRSQWAYLHAGDMFPHVEIPPGRPPATLRARERRAVREFEVCPGMTLDEYVAASPVSGIVVVHGGEIVYERYPRMDPGDRHLMMSVSKVFPSVIAGILARRGELDLRSPAGEIVPGLSGSGWAGVPMSDVLNMCSGIACPEAGPEAYRDPGHPFFRFEASLGWRPGGEASAYDYVAGLGSYRPPGEAYEYTSVNTFVLSWAAEVLTGLPFAAVIGREIWSRCGFQEPAQLCLSPTGAPVSHGGLSVTLRDLARFGMLFTPSWHLVAGQPVVDPAHLRDIQTAGRPQLHDDLADPPDYVVAAYGSRLPPAGRQWNFVTGEGDLFKGGFGGQGLYVSPGRDLVIAYAGVPREDGEVNLLRWYSRRLAAAIQRNSA